MANKRTLDRDRTMLKNQNSVANTPYQILWRVAFTSPGRIFDFFCVTPIQDSETINDLYHDDVLIAGLRYQKKPRSILSTILAFLRVSTSRRSPRPQLGLSENDIGRYNAVGKARSHSPCRHGNDGLMRMCLSCLSISDAVSEAVNSTPSPLSGTPAATAMTFRVRPAQTKDLSRLATLLTECFHPPVGWMYWLHPVLKLGIYEDLRSRLQNASPHYLCLVTEARGTAHPEALVGTVELTLRSSSLFGSQYPYIANLAVSPAYRRQGLASQLLKSCEPTVKQWGYREIYLHVLENNPSAIALYRSCGYRLHSTEAYLGSWLWSRPRRLLLRKSL